MKLFIRLSIAIFILASSFCFAAQHSRDYLNIALLFKEAAEYERAIEVLERARAQGFDERQDKHLAILYYLAGKSQKALNVLDRMPQKDWLAFLYLGLIYEDLGKTNKAKDAYLKTLELKNNSIALYRLAKIHYNKKSYRKAKQFFSQLIKLDPSIRLAYYYLGECFLKESDFERSYHYFSKAIKFYPQNRQLQKKLAISKKKLGKRFFAKRKKSKEKERKEVKLSAYIREEGIPMVRVGLVRGLERFSFRCGQDFIIKGKKRTFKGRADRFYTFVWSKKGIKLTDYKTNAVYRKFSAPIKIEAQTHPFYLLDVTYGKGDFWHKKIDRIYRGNLEIVAGSEGMNLINILSVEEYLYGVLPAEILPFVHSEALKAQAVAARTIAMRSKGRHRKEGFDFCNDVHCQVYQGLSVEKEKARAAVKETRGEVLLYEDNPIEAFYHSNCGGCLRSDMFGKRGYLVNKIDKAPSSSEVGIEDFSAYEEELWFKAVPRTFSSTKDSVFRWQRAYDAQDFMFIFGFALADLKEVVFLEEGDCFHHHKMQLETIRGTTQLVGDLKIRNFFDKLRSSAFKLEIKYSHKKVPQMLFFWGAGFGHGVGLSQKGAINMADQGFNYRQILRHYYPNTKLKKMY
ncbi:MAG: SpoIID/LytB domain-containing protein [Candidatus Omnitrophota bacterium]|nr:MAG: SpoIID/LytB domain-containing protein [Candidatus Omnitrophota bacterium]